ncbi:MAG: sulfur carrier protein ThiS [Bacteroidota bacterium]
MELKINNRIKFFKQETISVQQLLDIEMPQKQNGIAVAIDNHVIPKNNWENHFLTDSENILIISATQGG